MIVWGGRDSSYSNGGAAYNPTTDTWRTISVANAPSARSGHTAVWTGTEMIIWGGVDGSGNPLEGGRYYPDADHWAPVPTYKTTNDPSVVDQPTPRSNHTAVWTGTEMIIWGGVINHTGHPDSDYEINTGGRYDPVANVWRAVSASGAPAARSKHVSVWTGSEMIVWGGNESAGGRYNPADNSWTTISGVGGYTYSSDKTAVWTGSEMLLFGNRDDNQTFSYTPGRTLYLYLRP